MVQRGHAQAPDHGRPPQALLERAVRQAPARQEYHLLLAQVYIAQRDLKRVQDLLGPLVARGSQPRIRERALALLAKAAEDGGAGVAAATASSNLLVLRLPEGGEQRVIGLFERVECTDSVVRLHVRTAEREVSLRAPRLEAIDFINYRDDQVPPLGCRGDGVARRAVVTYRGNGDAAEAVAVEFVPDDYELR